MKKLLSLLTLLVVAISASWADDAVSATQTFTNERATCTWTSLSAAVSKGQTVGGDGLYFTAGANKAITSSGGTVQGGTGAVAGVYVQVASATSAGTITMTSSSDASNRILYLPTYDATTNPDAKVSCAKTGSSAEFTADDVVEYEGGYYVHLSGGTTDIKIKGFQIVLSGGETYPESVAVDPEFSLTDTEISTIATSQIVVGSKPGLDGIVLSDIVYGTEGVVTVDAETGVVTPVAAGTTTITFNSGAVAGKYNASTDKQLTITVREAVTVFDGDGVTNETIMLTLDNVNDKDYISTDAADKFVDRTWTGYEGKYLDMKTGRTISVNVKNVENFEFYLSGSSGRKFTVKIGDGEAVEYEQSSGSGFVSPGVISTGTTDEVTITIEGGSSTLYPVYMVVNIPTTETITIPEDGVLTYVTQNALDLTSVDFTAYVPTGVNEAKTKVMTAEVTSVPANTALLIKGMPGEYNVTIAASAEAPESNIFQVSDGSVTGGDNIFAYHKTDQKFMKVASTVTIPEGKCYLVIEGVGQNALDVDFEGEATAVDAIAEANANAAAPVKVIKNGKLYIGNYNVAGQQVK